MVAKRILYKNTEILLNVVNRSLKKEIVGFFMPAMYFRGFLERNGNPSNISL